MKIGELAKRSGLSAHTLRYYERIGLLPYADRNQSSQRDYDASILIWIEFLGRLRTTGMPIREMLRYAALRERGVGTETERRLSGTGRYRILTKLLQPLIAADRRPGFPRIGVIVDTETTGLSFRLHGVIEFGGVAFSFTDEGEIGDVFEVYGGLQEPKTPISNEITQLTGITNDMVWGQSPDIGAIERLIRSADLVIARNAAFDRPFCELISPVFCDVPWACSNAEIGWAVRGFEGNKLGYLVGQSGFFHDGHRAVDDCLALLEVLKASAKGEGVSPFAEMYQAASSPRRKFGRSTVRSRRRTC